MIDESTSYCHNHCNCSVLCNAYSTPPTLTLLVTLPLSLVARWWRQRPYTYPTPTVHHPTTIVKIRDVSPITLSPLIPMATSAATSLFPALIHPIEGIIAAIATVGGGLVMSSFIHKSYIFYIRMRVDLGQYNILWHKPTPTIHHTTIKWGRSAVPMRG